MPKLQSQSFVLRAMLLLAVCVVGALATMGPSGCFLYKDDPLYCAEGPNNFCACMQDSECSGATPVCKKEATETGGAAYTCVECTVGNADACVGAKPICNGATNTCRGCTSHADCAASAACLPDGACAMASQVAYVAQNGTDNDQCSKAMPCTKASKALATALPYVKFSGVTGDSITIAGGRQVTFLAEPGAKLRTGGSNAPNVRVEGSGTSLKVYDLAISDAFNDTNGYGILVPTGAGAPSISLVRATVSNNPAGGISVSGGALSVTRSRISGNTGGGISVSNGTFEIVNNFFFDNGGSNTTVGGLSITTTPNAMNRLEFNSFSKNEAQGGIGPGLHCVAGPFTARNNILSDNGTVAQYSGTCTHAYSIFTPGTVPGGADNPGNSASDPMFLDTNTGDLHVKPASPARGMAAPSSTLTGPAAVDIDGDSRVSPADVGADEVP